MTDPKDNTLDLLEEVVRTRRATRHFRPDAIPDGLLERLLDCARWAPSGYNLQPTHFVVVTDPALRQALVGACMGQPQVAEAPAVVVFCGDTRVWRNNFEEVLRLEKESGTMTPQYERLLRRFVPLAFRRGPLGLNFLWKAFLGPVGRLVTPIPEFPAVRLRAWLNRQAMLAAQTFMLSARAAGLDTCPMEGFDGGRVRRALGIPRTVIPVLVVPVGYSATPDATKTRLPLERMVHRNGW